MVQYYKLRNSVIIKRKERELAGKPEVGKGGKREVEGQEAERYMKSIQSLPDRIEESKEMMQRGIEYEYYISYYNRPPGMFVGRVFFKMGTQFGKLIMIFTLKVNTRDMTGVITEHYYVYDKTADKWMSSKEELHNLGGLSTSPIDSFFREFHTMQALPRRRNIRVSSSFTPGNRAVRGEYGGLFGGG